MNWIFIWKSVFIVGISLFSMVLVCVTIGGWKDLTKLRQHYRQKQSANDYDSPMS